MRSHSFHDYVVHDLLGSFSGITSRAMFGGWGVYKNGKIFAIIVGEALYFKYTDSNKDIFASVESGPFTYKKKDGKTVSMAYWLVPEELMEDRERFHKLVSKIEL